MAKRGSARKPKDGRQPTWSLVTFPEIEAWRAEHQVPKKTLAQLLGVTNSTWHNWQRGKSVATVSAQKRMKTLMQDGAGKLEELLERRQELSGSGRERRRARNGHASRGGDGELLAVGTIVAAYLSKRGGLDPTELTDLIRSVRAALHG